MTIPDDPGGVPRTPNPTEAPVPRLFAEQAQPTPPQAPVHTRTAQGRGGDEEGGGADLLGADEPLRSAGAREGEDDLQRVVEDYVARTLRRDGRRKMVLPEVTRPRYSPQQRLLILDTWLRSRLPAGDFSALLGISPQTLLHWKGCFEQDGPAGLDDKPLGRPGGSRLPDATKRAILLLKEQDPSLGQDKISAMLMRSADFQASPGAVGRVLLEAGYQVVEDPQKPHGREPQRFERAKPNQLWQTDLFTFVLKRENRRVHMVAFLDDHSRFVVGFGVHASAAGALVRETLEAAIANFGAPQEVLTDNGTQYVTWRGKSEFTRLLEQRGIKQIVASPRHPQTLGKIERFWGTLWRECVEVAVFRGLDDSRRRVGLFIDHYNFQRPHSGIDGLVPADRYFAAAPQVLATLKQRVAGNAAQLARDGLPRKPFYLTGRVGDQSISLHAEGEKVVLTKGDGSREEVDLGATGARAEPEDGKDATVAEPIVPQGRPADSEATAEADEEPPGASALDDDLTKLMRDLREGGAP